MAKYSAALVLLVVIVMTLMNVNRGETERRLGQNIDCGEACAYRCSKASRAKICLRACGACCARCNCVPPGTAGNTHVCPCYATMTTHGGRLKCP